MMPLFLNLLIFILVLRADWIISQDVDRLCPPITCPDSQSRISSTLTPHCHCDDQCGDYGDCCFDAPNKTKTTNESPYTCATFRGSAFFVKRACLNGNFRYQSKCSVSNNYTDHISQMHLKIPVTSKLGKNITYGNIFCAFCDNHTNQTLTYWNLMVTCGRWSTLITNVTFDGPNSFLKNQPELKKVLIFVNETKTWTYVNGSTKANCSMLPKVPNSLQKVVRPCKRINSTCPANFLVTNITNKCAEFQSFVYQKTGGPDYRNAYCALCHGVPMQNLNCYVPPPPTTTPRYYPSYLQQWSSRNLPTQEVKPRKKQTYLYIAIKSDCANLLNRIELTKIMAETVIYRTMNRTFIRNTTLINGTGIQVCHIDKEMVGKFVESEVDSTFFRLVVNIGCLCSCTFLLLHVWNLLVSKEPSLMSQKLSLSVAVAMFLGNIGFFYGSVSQIASYNQQMMCSIGNSVSYYGFLASLLWITSMAFDISCSVWGFAFDQANVLAKSQTTLFVIYSSVNWALPAVVVVSLYCYKQAAEGDTRYSCLLTDETILLRYFLLPLLVSLSVNLAFYSSTVFVVLTEDKVVGKMLDAGIGFKSHTCLIVTTNIMWLTIALAGYLDNHSLIVLFIACDLFLSSILYRCPSRKDARVTAKMVFDNHSVTVPQSDER